MAQSLQVPQPVTAEQLLALPDNGVRRELVEGEVVEMAPAGDQHDGIAQECNYRLSDWVRRHQLGRVHGADCGFWLQHEPDTVRAPDVAFVRRERQQAPVPGFSAIVPDLVVEVASPTDRRSAVLAKVGMWLEAGVQVVWVVWPQTRTVHIYRPDDRVSTLGVEDTLTCEELLPGFTLPVRQLFEAPGVSGDD